MKNAQKMKIENVYLDEMQKRGLKMGAQWGILHLRKRLSKSLRNEQAVIYKKDKWE